jgi:hypothetical protein
VPLAHVWLRARDLQMVLFLRVFELDEWPCGGSDRSRVRNFQGIWVGLRRVGGSWWRTALGDCLLLCSCGRHSEIACYFGAADGVGDCLLLWSGRTASESVCCLGVGG